MMKKLMIAVVALCGAMSMNAQITKSKGSVLGNVGYQSNYERFGVGVQGRYDIAKHLRIAPDVTFFFPKDKATGLDVNVNFHYVFDFSKNGQGFSVYPLAGLGMQNNFFGKQTIEVRGEKVELDRENTSKLALNLGGGISLPLSSRSYLNAEAKFMFAHEDNLVLMIGYGYRF